jgi:Uma2 family endonuclease
MNRGLFLYNEPLESSTDVKGVWMGALKDEYRERYTYRDYLEWEGEWELIEGVAYAMAPAPLIKHQELAGNILAALKETADACETCQVLMEVDYKVSDDTVLKPDVVLTCGESNDAYLTKAPEIVVEVISPSTAQRDERYKFSIYEEEKVRYFVLVYPDSLVAKIYKNIEGRFDKQGDFSVETYRFEDLSCPVSVDFEKVFRRYRNA